MARENSPEKILCGSGVPGKGWLNIIHFQSTLHVICNVSCASFWDISFSGGQESETSITMWLLRTCTPHWTSEMWQGSSEQRLKRDWCIKISALYSVYLLQTWDTKPWVLKQVLGYFLTSEITSLLCWLIKVLKIYSIPYQAWLVAEFLKK